MATIGQTLRAARARLDAADAERLLAHATGLTRAMLYARGDDAVPAAAAQAFEALVARRAAGEPVAYLVGRQGFWTLDLRVTPDTLIPRPDTERLVELALERIPRGEAREVLDLGTGSGAIALSLARERPAARVMATDASPAALEVAAGNAGRLGLSNVRFAQGDWWAAVDGARFDVVVSNPPYIAEADPHLGRGDLPSEPSRALASGPDGLDALRCIVTGAPARMRPGGWILLEHGFDQGAAVRALLLAAGFEAASTAQDLEGRDRVTSGCLPVPVRASSDRP